MGSYPFDELPVEDGDFDRSVEIGSSPVSSPITLMRVAPKDGEFCYLEEIPASLRFDRCDAEFSLGVDSSTPYRHLWWRFVVKVEKKETRIRVNNEAVDSLMLARWPYSSGWSCSRRFKNPSKKGQSVPDPRLTQRFATEKDFVLAVESLAFDYFETGNYFTAAISFPEEPFFEDAQNRNQNASILFGVCNNPQQTEVDLLEHPTILKLLAQTEANTIRFWPDGVATDGLKLYDEVKDKGPFLMLCSIRQALAGPHNSVANEFIGRPVTDLVDRIYRNHLNNENRGHRDV